MKNWTWMLGLGTALVSPAAAAQPIDGKFRLSLDGVLVASENTTVSGDVTTLDPVTAQTSKQRTEVDVSTSSTGLAGSGLGVGLGYAPSSTLVFGGRLMFGTQTRSVDTPGAEVLESNAVSFLPYLELMFSRDGVFRPMGFATVGIRSGGTVLGDTEVSSFSHVLAGGGAGAQIFAADGFSIAPAASLLFVSATEKMAGTELSGSGMAFMLTVSMSGWMGPGSGAPRKEFASASPDPGGTTPNQPAAARPKGNATEDSGPIFMAQHGTLSDGLVLPGGIRMRLVGKPAGRRKDVFVHVTIRDSRGRFAECRNVRFEVAERAARLNGVRYVEKGTGFGYDEIVAGTVSVDALADVGSAPQAAAFALCDERIDLPATEQARLMRYVASFRERFDASRAAAGSAANADQGVAIRAFGTRH